MRCPGSRVMPVSVQILPPSSVNSLDCSCLPAAPALTAGVCPEEAATSSAAEGIAPASNASNAILGSEAANLPVVFIVSILSCRADSLLYAKQRRRRQAATQGDSHSLMWSYQEPTMVDLRPGNGWTTLAAGTVIQWVMVGPRPGPVLRHGRFLDSSNGRLYIGRWLQQRQSWSSLRQASPPETPH